MAYGNLPSQEYKINGSEIIGAGLGAEVRVA
jgi:hypothetical protein